MVVINITIKVGGTAPAMANQRQLSNSGPRQKAMRMPKLKPTWLMLTSAPLYLAGEISAM